MAWDQLIPRLFGFTIGYAELSDPPMPIPQHLQRKLRDVLGVEAAEEVATRLEAMEVNRGDIGELRHEMELGFARVDARFEKFDQKFDQKFETLQAQFAGLEAKMVGVLEKGLKEQTRFFVLAWSVLLAAIVGLYAR